MFSEIRSTPICLRVKGPLERDEHVAFFRDYFSSRKIIDRGAGGKSDETPPAAGPTFPSA